MLNWFVEILDTCTPRLLKQLLKRTLPGIDRKIYGAVKRVTKDELREVTIRRGPLKGRRFRCSMKFERGYWLGVHEVELTEFIFSRLNEGDVFYDIGVHKGYFSLVAAMRIGSAGRVIGFEPNPHNREVSTQNFRLNPDLSPRIVLNEFAVSDRTGTQSFVGKPHATKGHLLYEESDQATNTYEVPTISLDEFLSTGPPVPTFIKMDIEGGERWALTGMTQVLSKHRPLLVVEVHDRESFDVLRKITTDCDYRLCTFMGQAVSDADAFQERSHYVAEPDNELRDTASP